MITMMRDKTGISLLNGDFWVAKTIKLYTRMIKIIDEYYSKYDFTRWFNQGVEEQDFLNWLTLQIVEGADTESYVHLPYRTVAQADPGLFAYELDWEVNDPTRIYYNLSCNDVFYVLQNTNHNLVFPTQHSILTYRDSGEEIAYWIRRLRS